MKKASNGFKTRCLRVMARASLQLWPFDLPILPAIMSSLNGPLIPNNPESLPSVVISLLLHFSAPCLPPRAVYFLANKSPCCSPLTPSPPRGCSLLLSSSPPAARKKSKKPALARTEWEARSIFPSQLQIDLIRIRCYGFLYCGKFLTR